MTLYKDKYPTYSEGKTPIGILWQMLLDEVNELNAESTWGLGSVWGFIDNEDYEGARAALDAAKKHWVEWRDSDQRRALLS